MNQFLWDLIVSEAAERYFVGDAPEPAFLICRGPFSPHGKWTLYMNSINEIASFTSLTKAEGRLKEIVAKAKSPVSVFKQTRKGRTLFAQGIGVAS